MVPLFDVTGNITLEGDIVIPEPTPETPALTLVESTTNIAIAAGAKEVTIYNAGGLAAASGTVNGSAFAVGRRERWEERQIGNALIQLPAIAIVCNGSLFQVSYRI